MITFCTDDLLLAETEAIVNTVNTVGVMGKGIALQFKERFPLNFKLYREACKKAEVKIGKMFITPTNHLSNPKWIINFPTKQDWRERSRIEYIIEGLDDLVSVIQHHRIESIAIPPLGCGNGGLNWEMVKPIVEEKLKGLDCMIVIYQPGYHSYHQTAKERIPALTKTRALILSLIDQYVTLGFELSHLEIQKLAYFLQVFGQEDLKLKFERGKYGPYANNLRHALTHLEGTYLKGTIRFADAKPLDELIFESSFRTAIDEAIATKTSFQERERLALVSNLIKGFESPLGLELLATVHWVNSEFKNLTIDSVIEKVHEWSERKRELMTPYMIKSAFLRIQEF